MMKELQNIERTQAAALQADKAIYAERVKQEDDIWKKEKRQSWPARAGNWLATIESAGVFEIANRQEAAEENSGSAHQAEQRA